MNTLDNILQFFIKQYYDRGENLALTTFTKEEFEAIYHQKLSDCFYGIPEMFIQYLDEWVSRDKKNCIAHIYTSAIGSHSGSILYLMKPGIASEILGEFAGLAEELGKDMYES